jgi:membrane protease YdiL (CAAX protease family)
MSGLSQLVNRTSGCREVVFWLLLLGSWQFLTASGQKNAVSGAVGAAAFVVFAWRNLGRLSDLGLHYAAWRPTTRAKWMVAAVSGLVAGVAVFGIGSASGQNMMLSKDWRIVLLQVTLGPVLEEVVFRGYLFAVLTWVFSKVANGGSRDLFVVPVAGVIFALVHLAQPGVTWLQLACIASTGTLYGCIRWTSGSAAVAAATHAAYNLTLYVMVGVVAAYASAAAGG